MSRVIRSIPRCRAAWIALCLLPGAAWTAILPGTVRAQGEPRPVAVSIEGEVRRPGSYTLPPGSTLSALLVAGGGFTDNAFLRGAVLTRISAEAAQEAELRGIVERVTRETGISAATESDARPVLELLAALRPSGRVPVRLSHPRLLKGTPADIPLEEGDVLRLPKKPDTVTVTGAVPAAPRSVPYTEKASFKEYLRQAGGTSDGADRDHVYLLRADGTVALLSLGFISWNPAASRWEVTALAEGPPSVGPGDTIIVPRHLPPGLPSKIARELPGLLMRAAEIAGTPVTLP